METRETVQDPDEIVRQNKKEYMRNYREKKKARFKIYQKRYYQTHRDKILDKKAKTDPEGRRCLWCGKDISNVRPRHTKFCNLRHRDLHNRKRKREWYAKRSKEVSSVSPV